MDRFEKFFFEKRYPLLTQLIKKNTFLLTLFKMLYYGLPIMIAAAYIVYVIHRFRAYGKRTLLKTVGVPAAAYIGLSVFRRLVNFKRPYEKFDYMPILGNYKKGKSMPSRHTFSAGIIGAVMSSDYPMLAPFTWIAVAMVALTRLLAGVHHIRDLAVSVGLSLAVSFMLKIPVKN